MNFHKKVLPVVILAGGLATRLLPMTSNIPKALVKLADEPFIAHQLRLLKSRGIKRVVICAGHLGEMIQDFVGDGSNFNIDVEFVFDGERLLGTGGALKKALPLLEETFFVLYGDSYLPCDYIAVHNAFEQTNKQALMTVFFNHNQWDKSNVEFRDGQLIEYNKYQPNDRMNYIDYGLGVFRSSAFDVITSGTPCDLAEIYRLLLQKGEVAAFEVMQRFYEVGSFKGWEELDNLLKEQVLDKS